MESDLPVLPPLAQDESRTQLTGDKTWGRGDLTLHGSHLLRRHIRHLLLRYFHHLRTEHDGRRSIGRVLPLNQKNLFFGKMQNFFSFFVCCARSNAGVTLCLKPQNTQSVCTTREKETDRDTFFFNKNCPAKK